MFLACPGSLIPNLLAKDDSGFDAAWGSVAHSVTEEWLNTGRAPEHLVGTRKIVGDDVETWHVIDIDEAMLEAAEQCVDRCEWVPGEHVIEQHVQYSHLTPIPNQGGTLDFAAMTRGLCNLKDHKFGKSPDNIVHAEENTQLMLYAIGLMRDPQFEHYAFTDFILGINQPRLDHFDEWHTTRERLLEFEAYAKERMHLAWSIDAPRVAGMKQCRFCRVKGSCATNAKMQEDLLDAVFTDESTTSVEDFLQRLDDDMEPFRLRMASIGSLTTAQKARLLPYRKSAEAWWSALQADLERAAIQGEHVPGYKVVEARAKRFFSNPRAAERQLVKLGVPYDEFIEERMVSPAQAEKILLRYKYKRKQLPELLEGLVSKPTGKATLAPLSDKRQALVDLSSIVFEDEANREPEEEL